MNRRDFLAGVAAGAALRPTSGRAAEPGRTRYQGPNVIIIRFGGGVRRRETIDADAQYSPFLKHVLVPKGVLFPKMEIASRPGVSTSHGEGTLNILTGIYDVYKDVGGKFLGSRFEPRVPTLFECLRKQYPDVPEHQALIINGEDRIDEEFYSFSNHHLFGVHYRSTVLSLYRFKLYLLRTDLAAGRYKGKDEQTHRKELAKLEALDLRARDAAVTSPELDAFWAKWAAYYGKTGLVNPRGDRLLAELAVRAMRELRPRLMMVNFNDPDYVHWGIPSHYTRGVTIVDDALRRIYEAAQADQAYRDRTVFMIAPDCGRDSNPFMSCPYQHHFNSKSAHQVFALAVGPGIDQGRLVDKPTEQCSIAATVARIMNFPMPTAQGSALAEVFA
jgi:hypothetical protein